MNKYQLCFDVDEKYEEYVEKVLDSFSPWLERWYSLDRLSYIRYKVSIKPNAVHVISDIIEDISLDSDVLEFSVLLQRSKV